MEQFLESTLGYHAVVFAIAIVVGLVLICAAGHNHHAMIDGGAITFELGLEIPHIPGNSSNPRL